PVPGQPALHRGVQLGRPAAWAWPDRLRLLAAWVRAEPRLAGALRAPVPDGDGPDVQPVSDGANNHLLAGQYRAGRRRDLEPRGDGALPGQLLSRLGRLRPHGGGPGGPPDHLSGP